MSRAAGEYERVAAEADDPELRREALLEAGELYETSKATDRALAVYLAYVSQFPEPVETAVETRFKIAEMYQVNAGRGALPRSAAADRGDRRRSGRRAQRTDPLSRGALGAGPHGGLLPPLRRNRAGPAVRAEPEGKEAAHGRGARRLRRARGLRGRRSHRGSHLLHGGDLLRLQPGADRIGTSGRSRRRRAAEIRDALEEEAFPFEEKAIEVHRKNLELLASGVYNPWIEKSLGRLADLMPGRYAKFEASSGLIASIDSYAYQAPKARCSAADDRGESSRPRPGAPPQHSTAPRHSSRGTQKAPRPSGR